MDVNRLLLDLCQVLDPVKRNELQALKAATDATAGQFAEVKRERAAVEGQRDRTDAVAAAASAAAATANAAAATANDDAEEALALFVLHYT